MQLLCTMNFLNLSECDLRRQAEAGAEHLLVRADQADIVNVKFNGSIATASDTVFMSDSIANALGNPLANVNVIIYLVLGVAREAVDVNHRQELSSVRGEERLFASIKTLECVQKLNGSGREVHDIVVDNRWASIHLRWWGRFLVFRLLLGLSPLLSAFLSLDSDSDRVSFQKGLRRMANELPPVHVERSDKVLDAVTLNSILHDLVAMRVQVVTPDEDALTSRRHSKGTDTRHDIADHLSRLKFLHESAVLSLQTAVPVDARVIESELAFLLVLNDVQVVVTSQQLERESTELAVRANIFGLVDNSADGGVLVHENLCNDVFIRQPMRTEVQVH